MTGGRRGAGTYSPAQRILALIGAALLLGLAASAFFVVLFGGEQRTELALRLLALAVFLPILLWLFIWAIGRTSGGKRRDEAPEAAADGAIRTVVFDIGGVLVGFDYRAFIAGRGNDAEMTERIVAATVKSPWWKEYDRGVMAGGEIMDKFCEDAPEIEAEIRSTFASIHGLITRRDETIPWIRALKKKGYQVLVLSNYSQKALDDCPEAVDFLDEVDGGILSFRDHVIKPDPAIYRLLMERYDLTPEETVFIDDLPENIEAARALGWKGVVWQNRAQTERELAALGVAW